MIETVIMTRIEALEAIYPNILPEGPSPYKLAVSRSHMSVNAFRLAAAIAPCSERGAFQAAAVVSGDTDSDVL